MGTTHWSSYPYRLKLNLSHTREQQEDHASAEELLLVMSYPLCISRHSAMSKTPEKKQSTHQCGL